MAVYARYHYGDDIAITDPELLSKFCKRRVSLMTTLSHHKKVGNITPEEYDVLRHYAHIANLKEIELFPLDALRKGFLAIEDFGEYVTEKPNFPSDIKRNKGEDIDKYCDDLCDLIRRHRELNVKDNSLAQDFNYCIKFLEKRQRQYREEFMKGKDLCASSSENSEESPSEVKHVLYSKKGKKQYK